jgi:hypothetical protein
MEFTHIANPVRVEAVLIVDVDITGPIPDNGVDVIVSLADGTQKDIHLTGEMISRFVPSPGDYLVTQADGYQYVNPKSVFERKYRRIDPTFENSGAALVDAFAERDMPAEDAEIKRLKRELEEARQLLSAERFQRSASYEQEIRHSIVMQLIPGRNSRFLDEADRAVKYVLTGTLPDSK